MAAAHAQAAGSSNSVLTQLCETYNSSSDDDSTYINIIPLL